MRKPSAVAIYARISSDQDGTAAGVKRQVADCRALAEREGWTVAEEYIDNDVSAYSKKRRPRFEQMLADMRDGVRDAVIVYHQDRLTRQPIDLEHFLQAANAGGVQHVRFVSGPGVDVANGDGLMVVRMLAVVAANESDSKSRRVRRRLDANAAAGVPHGGSRRPFGFGDDRITHRPDEAAVIRDLTARFLAGESLRSLAQWLDDEQVLTVFGKPWRSSTLRDLLMSPRIAGLRQHRGEVIGPAVWDAIISPADHARVLALMAQRTTGRERSVRSYLLSGLGRCGRCEGRLFAARRENNRRYVCQSGPDHRGCGRLTIVAEPLEQLVTEAVLYRLDGPELAAVLAGRNAEDDHTAALSDALAQDQLQLEELAALHGAREITTREWMIARKPVEARISDTQRKLARATGNDALTGIVGNGVELRAQWSTLNLTRQHAIVKAVLDHVVVAPSVKPTSSFDPTRIDLVWRV